MRGQISYVDFLIGLSVFIIAVTVFFSYTNIANQRDRPIDTATLSESLLSSGYPVQWNTTDVIRAGLLTNESLDARKWMNLSSIVSSDPERADTLLATTFTYRLSIEPSSLPVITNDPTPTTTNLSNIGNVRRTRRIVAYNGTIVTLEVIGWR